MDIATILGIFIAFGLVLFAILTGEGAGTFLNIPSLSIVFGGTTGTVLVCFPLKTVLSTLSIAKKAFFAVEVDRNAIISTLEELAKTARKEGLLALEGSRDAWSSTDRKPTRSRPSSPTRSTTSSRATWWART
jgi:chemotaxis protein MotA